MAISLARTIQLLIRGDGTTTVFSIDLNFACSDIALLDFGGTATSSLQPGFDFKKFPPSSVLAVRAAGSSTSLGSGTISGTNLTITFSPNPLGAANNQVEVDLLF